MSGLKEFWSREWEACHHVDGYSGKQAEHIQYRLGLFFWGRGGKQFVLKCRDMYWNPKDKVNHYPSFDSMFCWAKQDFENNKNNKGFVIEPVFAQDFLDCVACLGEERVKELIKELEGVKE